jgi:hypothetical protein
MRDPVWRKRDNGVCFLLITVRPVHNGRTPAASWTYPSTSSREDEDTADRREAVGESRPVEKEGLMGDKSPKKSNAKKPGKTLKEKRADKSAKREEKRPGFGG